MCLTSERTQSKASCAADLLELICKGKLHNREQSLHMRVACTLKAESGLTGTPSGPVVDFHVHPKSNLKRDSLLITYPCEVCLCRFAKSAADGSLISVSFCG